MSPEFGAAIEKATEIVSEGVDKLGAAMEKATEAVGKSLEQAGSLDDSGRKLYIAELPDDSGEKFYGAELPDDSGEKMPEEDADGIDSELDKKYNEYIDEGGKDAESIEDKQGELSDADRAKLKEETGWSDEVVDSIDTSEQAEIYKNADLHEDNINGRECLVKEIDYDYVDEKTGMTNRELMAKGRSPYDAKTGEKIELHHMGQEYDAPFAELTENSEHGDGNHSILHPKTEGSWRNDETLEAQYNKEKREYWKTRSEG